MTFESGISGISGLSELSGRWRCNSSANIYGGCAQASLKSPYKPKCSRLPRLGELSAEQTEGSYYRYKSKMRLTDGTILLQLPLPASRQALPREHPRRGERANRFEESIF